MFGAGRVGRPGRQEGRDDLTLAAFVVLLKESVEERFLPFFVGDNEGEKEPDQVSE